MASFGEELRRERELRDISLKEIAEATKISMRFLEALEQDNFDILPGGIFNRGFIRAYARFIGIDGEEMVNAYLHEVSLKQTQMSPGTSSEGKGARRGRGFSDDVFRPESIPPVRTNGDGEKQHTSVPFEIGSAIRNVSESTAGRTSLILWVLVVITFVIGASVITLSILRDPAEASAADDAPTLAAEDLSPAQEATDAASSGTEEVARAGAGSPPAEPRPAKAKPAQPGPAESKPGQTPSTETPTDRKPARNDQPENKPQSDKPADRPETQPPDASNAPSQARPVPTTPASTPPVALPEQAETPPATAGVVRHQVNVLATEATHVRIECNGRVALFQELWPGASREVNCAEPVILSADNGGAVRYSVDGGPVTLLGKPGQRVHAVTVAPKATRR